MTENMKDPRYSYNLDGYTFAYFIMPKPLFKDKKYDSLSFDAKALYCLLLDEMSKASMYKWKDKDGRLCLHYTIEKVMLELGCKKRKAISLFEELEKYSLVERSRGGYAKGTTTYVNKVFPTNEVKKYGSFTSKFVCVPKMFFMEEFYRDLTAKAKIAYCLMRDKADLSEKNGIEDENGNTYINFQRKEMAESMNCSEKTISRVVKELAEFGLIETKRIGGGLPDRIYVINFLLFAIANGVDEQPYISNRDSNDMSVGTDRAPMVGTDRAPMVGTDRAPMVGTDHAPMVGTDSAPMVGTDSTPMVGTKSIPMVGTKTTPNKTNKNKTKSNNTQSIYQATENFEASTSMDEIETSSPLLVKEQVEAQINYEFLVGQRPDDKKMIDTIVKIIRETMVVREKTVRIGSKGIPYELVIDAFSELTDEHILYVLDSLESAKNPKNGRAYILTTLYHAPDNFEIQKFNANKGNQKKSKGPQNTAFNRFGQRSYDNETLKKQLLGLTAE